MTEMNDRDEERELLETLEEYGNDPETFTFDDVPERLGLDPDTLEKSRMKVLTAVQAAEDLPGLIGSVCEGEPVVITSSDHRAVLIAEDEYRGLIETLYLLQDPDMVSDLNRTRKTQISKMKTWMSVSDGPSADSENTRSCHDRL